MKNSGDGDHFEKLTIKVPRDRNGDPELASDSAKRFSAKMKNLLRCVVGHADRHLKLLLQGGQQVGLSQGQMRQIAVRMENVLGQIAQIIRQAHERIIGGRQLPNKDKILSLYDPDLQVIKRGKAGAEVEFGNNLWLGESSDGFIVDYLLERVKTSDSKQVIPASKRLIEEHSLPVTHVWGDRGLRRTAHKTNKLSHSVASTAAFAPVTLTPSNRDSKTIPSYALA